MTSTVTIEAHCSDDKEVRVLIVKDNSAESFSLQNGGKESQSFFDDIEISVKEVVRKE